MIEKLFFKQYFLIKGNFSCFCINNIFFTPTHYTSENKPFIMSLIFKGTAFACAWIKLYIKWSNKVFLLTFTRRPINPALFFKPVK